jgi:hypothetical protein
VDDLAELLDSHDCVREACSKGAHRARLRLLAEDVTTPESELRTLIRLRDALSERGFRMLEMTPPPRAATPWVIRYEIATAAGAYRGGGSLRDILRTIREVW